MGIFDYFKPPAPAPPPTPAPRLHIPARHVARRARLTVDDEPSGWGAYLVNQPDHLSDWRSLDLNDQTLSRMSPADLLELMVDVSPEVSRALWDFLRFCNPGWEATAYRVDGETIDPRGQAALDDIIDTLGGLYGTVDVFIGQLFFAGFIRGSLLAELVLGENGRDFIDIATPDPIIAKFKRIDDPQRGRVWQLGQIGKTGIWTPLDVETVKYVPFDPFPGKPHGRSLAGPAIFSTLFLIGLLHDLRRVIAQQGYPRIDLEINFERLQQIMPSDFGGDPDKVQEWVDGVFTQITNTYSNLEPDDAYVHLDLVTVKSPVGTLNSDLSAVDGLTKMIERMSTRALKSMSLLMDTGASVSETHANRQWEIHTAGIRSIQHYCENLLDHLLTLALQAQGIPALVEFRFAELRAAEELRDAQVEMMKIQNAKAKFEAGWISQDEAAEEVTGHLADSPEPRTGGNGLQFIGDALGGGVQSRSRAVQLIPNGSEQPLPPEPSEVEIGNPDADKAIRQWDVIMPEYAGLLNATVIGQTDYDDEFTPGDSAWEWDQARKRYRNRETGETVNQRRAKELRDLYVERLKRGPDQDRNRRDVGALADRLASGDINVQRWLVDMREEVKDAYLNQYMMGKGGKQNMTFSDYGRVGRMLAPDGQYHHLQQFAEAIKDGNLSAAQIRARAQQYIASSTQAYERGKAAASGIGQLPQYPGDGNTQCRANCKCEWVITETDEAFECSWTLNPAEHCPDCLANAARWNPLVIPKTVARSRAELDKVLSGLTNGKAVG